MFVPGPQGNMPPAATPSSVVARRRVESICGHLSHRRRGANICGASAQTEGETNDFCLPSEYAVVVGGCVCDLLMAPLKGTELILETSTPGQIRQSWGGVGRNIAECLCRLQAPPVMLSVVGQDLWGNSMKTYMSELGADSSKIKSDDTHKTAVYAATFDSKGDLVTAIADMAIFSSVDSQYIEENREVLQGARVVVVDGNMSANTIRKILSITSQCPEPRPRVIFEPTSVAKSVRISETLAKKDLGPLFSLTPNLDEAVSILEAAGRTVPPLSSSMTGGERIDLAKGYCREFRDLGVEYPVITLGEHGAVVGGISPEDATHLHSNPVRTVNCTGAGDCFVGGFAWGLLKSLSVEKSVQCGMQCARAAVQSPMAVPQTLSPDLFFLNQ